jgi:hypothetical protein
LCRLENQRKIEIYTTIFSNLCFEQHETMNIVDSIVTITGTRLDNTGDALAAETKIFRSEGRRPQQRGLRGSATPIACVWINGLDCRRH